MKEFKTYFKEDIPKRVKKTAKENWYAMQKRSAEKSKLKNIDKRISLNDWYKAIHSKFNGICQEKGVVLSFSNKHCAHLLPKSLFEEFSLDLENGLLVSWDIHDIIDKGSAKQRLELKCWSLICDRRKKMLESKGYDYDENYWLNSKF